MERRPARLVALVGLFCGVAAAGSGCSSSTPATTTPTPAPVLATDTFTGIVRPLGSDSHSFTVTYAVAPSDASVTVTSLTTVAAGTPQAITIGVGFGTTNLGVCTLSSLQNTTAPLNTELPTSGFPFAPGVYCVQVFDNPVAPTVTEPLNYAITVKHF